MWQLRIATICSRAPQNSSDDAGGGGGWTGPTTNLTHRWSLADADVSGTTINDLVGALNGTAAGGIASTTGPTGGSGLARSNDGSGRISLASAPIPALTSAHSAFCWIKITQNNDLSSGGSSQTLWSFFIDASNTVRVSNDDAIPGNLNVSIFKAGVETSAEKLTGTDQMPDGTWVHIGYTWNGTTIRIYLNGTEVTSLGTNSATFGQPAANFLSSRAAANGNVTGSQAQIVVYDAAVDASVAAIFAAN